MKNHNRPNIGHFVHTVFFWLKEPENSEAKTAFETSITKLINTSDYIQTAHLGTAPAASRDVVDGSFTYCYVVTFESEATQAAYQIEPAHLAFVEESQHLWTKVIVYDSVQL